MGKKKTPSTPALRALKGTPHQVLTYAYVPRGGTAASAAALDLDEHHVIKTLVFEDDARKPLIVLMHGDRSVSAKALARQIGARSVKPCAPDVAQRHTGYQVGGTSPFGTRKALPIYVEASILGLDWLVINGGARGLLVRVTPEALSPLGPVPVQAARPHGSPLD